MKEQIQKRLSDSKAARWTALTNSETPERLESRSLDGTHHRVVHHDVRLFPDRCHGSS